MKTELIIRAPDDFHIHLRDGQALKRTVLDASKQCARVLVMPNLTPAIDTLSAAQAYHQRIMAQVPEKRDFTALMSLYLSDQLTPETVLAAKKVGIYAVKWYPKGATTNSAQGVADVAAIYPILEAMEQANLLLLIHGEVTTAGIDIFDRESTFIDNILKPLRQKFPRLKMVLEHITTARAVEFVQSQKNYTAATITAHHLLFNRNALLVGGIKPHFYCLPILKTEADRQALLQAIASGDGRFFLGTDSAPHEKQAKENACGCAGCYTAHATLPLYAQAFEEAQALDKLENFASYYGAQFYDLPLNSGERQLIRQEQNFSKTLTYGSGEVIPFLAGEKWAWQLGN